MGRTQRQRQQRKRLPRPASPSSDDFPRTLFQHLNAQGWQNDTQLSVRNFAATGRGLSSKTRSFAPHDRLISLPLKCLITVATLAADADFKAQFNAEHFNKDQRVPFQALLALYLLHQRHRAQRSPLDAYLRSIPTHFTTPYFCTMHELQCLPEAVLESTVAQNRKIRESLLNLKSHFGASNCACCGRDFFAELYTLDSFKWAYFAVNSRSVFVPSRQVMPSKCFFQPLLGDEATLALAPLLDLFNHSDAVKTNAELVKNSVTKKQEFVITLEISKTPIVRPYAEIFINYGALSNFKLLTEYGFILPDNSDDHFEFSLLDIENLIRTERRFKGLIVHRNKFKFIRDHNLHEMLFVHPRQGISHNLHVVLHLIFKEASHFPNVLCQAAFGALELLDSVEDEVRLMIDFKIAEYGCFLSDLAKLSALSESGHVARQYMEECVRFLTSYQELN